MSCDLCLDLVLVHSAALIAPLAPFARRIDTIEHHARDALADLAPHRPPVLGLPHHLAG